MRVREARVMMGRLHVFRGGEKRGKKGGHNGSTAGRKGEEEGDRSAGSDRVSSLLLYATARKHNQERDRRKKESRKQRTQTGSWEGKYRYPERQQ